MLWLLIGCPYIDNDTYRERVQDADGDGSIGTRFNGSDCDDDNPELVDCDQDDDGQISRAFGGTDCDDMNPEVYAGALEICNAIDDDCDGRIDDADDLDPEVLLSWHADADGDGFGVGTARRQCAAPPGFADNDLDCDDGRGDIYPGAPEFCGPTDHDCNGDPEADAVDRVQWHEDFDADGARGLPTQRACDRAGELPESAPEDCNDQDPSIGPDQLETWYDGIDTNCDGANDFDQDGDGAISSDFGGDDCDDTQADVGPGSPEICDGQDNDCDGLIDDADNDLDPTSTTDFYVDSDGDGFGNSNGTAVTACSAPFGRVADATDCDDGYAATYPGAPEVCDGLDNDCQPGGLDQNPVAGNPFAPDIDGDSFGDANGVRLVCAGVEPPDGFIANTSDCNDADDTVFPGAPEICGDAIRQDCAPVSVDDCDADGFIDQAAGGDDCDDADDTVSPAADEICDGLDNDCDGTIDVNATGPLVDWFPDADGDGVGTTPATLSCAAPPDHVLVSGDCDDTNADIGPLADEVCDGEDNDCDGLIDDADDVIGDIDAWFDGDDDGFGAGDPVVFCAVPSGYVLNGDDCNDAQPAVNPNGSEVCNGVDDNCSGIPDDSAPDAQLYFTDGDLDGFGTPSLPVYACAIAPGRVSNDDDCNDADPTVNPAAVEICGDSIRQDCSTADLDDCDADGFLPPVDCDDEDPATNPSAMEVCDGADNDCDGLTDDADPDIDAGDAITWYLDSDGDEVGGTTSLQSCSPPTNHVAVTGDCDDGNPFVSPDADEVCDGIDNDCDDAIDDADSGVTGAPFWTFDGDGDGVGVIGTGVFACIQPGGTAADAGDCNDNDPQISPNEEERCNFFDDDCDGLVDDADASVTGRPLWYPDVDQDGYAAATGAVPACSAPPNTLLLEATEVDCNDNNAAVNPNATEICNGGIDDDCDGDADEADDDFEGVSILYRDADGDGYGDPDDSIDTCEGRDGYVTSSTDCDDTSAAINPGANEVCSAAGAPVDENCNGSFDGADLTLVGGDTYYRDEDADGFGDPNDSRRFCQPQALYADNPRDCDDTDEEINERVWVIDADGDGRGEAGGSGIFSCSALMGRVISTAADDCDDGDPTVNPLVAETYYDGTDNDCDPGTVDNDQDGDGFAGAASPRACNAPAALRDSTTDCDDGDPSRNPSRTEVHYNGVDENCYCADDDDADGDGWAVRIDGESVREGFLGFGDCDDGDAGVTPAADPASGDPLVWNGAVDVADVQLHLDQTCDPTVRIDGTRSLGTEGLDVDGRDLELSCVGSTCTLIDGPLDLPVFRTGAGPAVPRVPNGHPSVVVVDGVDFDGGDMIRSTPGVRLGGRTDALFSEVVLRGYDNLSTPGGGLRVDADARAELLDVVFEDNASAVSGGVLFAGGAVNAEGITSLDNEGAGQVYAAAGSRVRLVDLQMESTGSGEVGFPFLALYGDLAVVEDSTFLYTGPRGGLTTPENVAFFIEHDPVDFGTLWISNSRFAGVGGVVGSGAVNVCGSKFAKARQPAFELSQGVLDLAWSDIVLMDRGVKVTPGLMSVRNNLFHINATSTFEYQSSFTPEIVNNRFTNIFDNFGSPWRSSLFDFEAPGMPAFNEMVGPLIADNIGGSGTNPTQMYATSIGTGLSAVETLDRIQVGPNTMRGSTPPGAGVGCQDFNPPMP